MQPLSPSCSELSDVSILIDEDPVLALNPPQQAAAKTSDREHTMALWTLNVWPPHVIVKSDPFPEARSLGRVKGLSWMAVARSLTLRSLPLVRTLLLPLGLLANQCLAVLQVCRL